MTPEAVQKGLKTCCFGRDLHCLTQVGSTNDVALNLAAQGASEGTAVTAEIQTRGRGRQGRRWLTTKGKSLVFSLVLRPRIHPDEMAEITLAAAVATAKAMEDYGFKPAIKWPNDLLMKGRKVCGILTETANKKDKITAVILGIGINLNQAAKDFPAELRRSATSLYRASGKKTDRVEFFQKLLLCLEETYQWVVERKFSKVLSEWKKRADILGKQVEITQAGRTFYGQAVDLDEKGALLVRGDLGFVERITSGDVRMLRVRRVGKFSRAKV